MTVFHESDSIPRSVMIVRGDMDRDIRDALQRALAGMEHDPAAEEVLDTYYDVARYDPFVGEVSRDLESVRTQYDTIQDLFD